MIDACHIIPFSESHDDTICNGISLCTNLHRALDGGLIAIDESYMVLIKAFTGDSAVYSIKQFEGKQIFLPSTKDYYPSQTNLSLHRNRFKYP